MNERKMKYIISTFFAPLMVLLILSIKVEAEGNNNWNSIQEVINASENDCLIELQGDIVDTESTGLVIPEGKNVVINFNGFSAVSSEEWDFWKLDVWGTLTLTDIASTNELLLNNIVVHHSGSLIIENGYYVGEKFKNYGTTRVKGGHVAYKDSLSKGNVIKSWRIQNSGDFYIEGGQVGDYLWHRESDIDEEFTGVNTVVSGGRVSGFTISLCEFISTLTISGGEMIDSWHYCTLNCQKGDSTYPKYSITGGIFGDTSINSIGSDAGYRVVPIGYQYAGIEETFYRVESKDTPIQTWGQLVSAISYSDDNEIIKLDSDIQMDNHGSSWGSNWLVSTRNSTTVDFNGFAITGGVINCYGNITFTDTSTNPKTQNFNGIVVKYGDSYICFEGGVYKFTTPFTKTVESSTLLIRGGSYSIDDVNNYLDSGFKTITVNEGEKIWYKVVEDVQPQYQTVVDTSKMVQNIIIPISDGKSLDDYVVKIDDIEKEVYEIVKDGKKYAACSIECSAKEMSDEKSFVIMQGNDEVFSSVISVRQYLLDLIDSEYPNTIKDAAKAMLVYGTAAQLYFDYNTDNPANKDLGDSYSVDILDSISIEEPDCGVFDNSNINAIVDNEIVTYYGMNMSFESDTSLLMAFKIVGDTTFETAKEEVEKYLDIPQANSYIIEVLPDKTNKYVIIRVNNIPIKKLGEVVFDYGDIPISAMQYMYKIDNSNSAGLEMKRLVHGLILLYNAVQAAE